MESDRQENEKNDLKENGALTIKNLPFHAGEKIEVIIIPRAKFKTDKKQYPFWGKPIKYLNPTDPINSDGE
jgi:hypothetical protein